MRTQFCYPPPKGWKSVQDVPKLVDDYMKNKLKLDEFITHKLKLDQVNEAFDLLKSGERWDQIFFVVTSFCILVFDMCLFLLRKLLGQKIQQTIK